MSKATQAGDGTSPKKRKRGQGEGSIFYIEDKKLWCGKHSVGYDDNGKRKRLTIYGKTQGEVREKLTAARAEIDKGTYIEPSRMTLSHWMDIWLKEYKKSSVKSTTYANYFSATQVHINPALGKCKLEDLRNDMVQKFINTLNSKGLARETVCATYKTLNLALKQAQANGLVAKNVAEGVNLPKKTKKEMRVLTVEEQACFIESAKGTALGELLILDLATGLRLGELLALTWDDVNFEDGSLRVNKSQFNIRDVDDPESKWHDEVGPPKTKSSNRVIPLLPSAVQMLKDLKKVQYEAKQSLIQSIQNDNRVFCNSKGEYVSESLMRYHFKQTLKKAGLDKTGLHIHCLRHTFATRCLEKGIELKVVQELLGHATLSMTADLYTHVLPDKKKQSVMKLADTIII